MKICKYSKSEDLGHVIALLLARDLPVKLASELPEHGFVTYTYDDKPIAAGFIRRVEGGFAILDSLITDPKQPGALRDEAIDLVVTRLIKCAKGLGITQLTATTVDENTLKRSAKHGFVKLPHACIALSLLGKEF